MLICSECGKTIANTNPRVHYAICADCKIPEDVELSATTETLEQMSSEEANHDLHNRDMMAKSMVAWLVDWGYVEIKNTDEGSCIIPSDILKTGETFKRESLLMGDGEPTTADKYNKEWIDNEKTKT
jgi:hypothetical protein